MTDEPTRASLDAIGFLAGTALSALLWLMQRRVDRAAGRPSGYQLLWANGFVWSLGSFLRCTLPLAGAGATSVHVATMFSWTSTIVGPIAIGRFMQDRFDAAGRTGRAFLAFSWGVSLLNLGLFVTAAARHPTNFDASGYPSASLCVALIMTAIALGLSVVRRHELVTPASQMPRWFGRTALLLAAVQVSAAVLGMQRLTLPSQVVVVVNLVSAHWIVPWSILIAVSLAQIHFADVVLKRSLWLLASLAASALAAVFVLRVEPGLPLIVATLSGAALMLASPWLIRALDRLVDHVWLERADYASTTRVLEESTRNIHDAQQLFDEVARTVRNTLRLEARCVAQGEGAPPFPRTLASFPIEAANGAAFRFEVSSSHEARTLMQPELGFLGFIGTLVIRRLDAIHHEQEQRALHLREERLKRLLTEAELKALRTQVDPHFLFNTLNTIADLINTNPVQAERMTERLAECFRYALSRHSRDLSTLDDELEFARHYLHIEQARFGERLRVELSRGDARGDELVPSLLLQPLLENAIKHGLAPIREGGRVSVVAKRDGDCLRLEIEDDGVGLRRDFADRLGVGLQNVRDRLQALYPQGGEMVIGERAGGRGTAVRIRVPLHAH